MTLEDFDKIKEGITERVNNCLETFDELDLNDPQESRLAVYALEDYYGVVLSEVGSEYIGFESELKGQNIGHQWNIAKTRLRNGIDCEIPSEYNDIINKLNDTRRSVAHGYQHRPDIDRLTDARRIAEEWRKWFSEKSKKYQESEGDVPVSDQIRNRTVNELNSVLVPPNRYENTPSKQKQEQLNEEVRDFVRFTYNYKLIKKEGYRVRRRKKDETDWMDDYVDSRDTEKEDWALSDFEDYKTALEFKTKSMTIQQEYHSFEEEKEKTKSKNIVSNGTICTIIEGYDEDTEVVHLYAPQNQEHIWQDSTRLPEEVQEKLIEKKPGDTIAVILGNDLDGDSYIKAIIE
jgi:hypothetical protein